MKITHTCHRAAGVKDSSIIEVAINTELTKANYIIIGTAALDIQLPLISDVGIGTTYRIRSISGDIVIKGAGGGVDQVEGAASATLTSGLNRTVIAVKANEWRVFQ